MAALPGQGSLSPGGHRLDLSCRALRSTLVPSSWPAAGRLAGLGVATPSLSHSFLASQGASQVQLAVGRLRNEQDAEIEFSSFPAQHPSKALHPTHKNLAAPQHPSLSCTSCHLVKSYVVLWPHLRSRAGCMALPSMSLGLAQHLAYILGSLSAERASGCGGAGGGEGCLCFPWAPLDPGHWLAHSRGSNYVPGKKRRRLSSTWVRVGHRKPS